MQGDGQRSITTVFLLVGAFLAVYAGVEYFFGPPPEAPTASVEAPEPTAAEHARAEAERRRDSPERQARRQTLILQSEAARYTIDNLAGGVTHAELLEPRYQGEDGRPLDLVTTWVEPYLPLRTELPGVEIPADAVWELRPEGPRAVLLSWSGRGVEVLRRIELGTGPYELWHTVQVRNVAGRELALRLRESTWHYVRREDEGGGFLGRRSPALSSGVCRAGDETTRKTRDELPRRHGYRAPQFVAIENVYFVQALAPNGEQAEYCGLESSDRYISAEATEPDGSLFEATLLYPTVHLSDGEAHVWRTLAYLGPKDPNTLAHAGHGLPEVMNLGTFALIAGAFARLLGFIQGHVGNWGLAIVILTILVRLALFPLTDRSFRSMAQMRKLKPEMDQINATYADDLEKKNAAVMELYRRHGINPLAQLGGCLPVLFQMPVFFALYTSLSTNVELYHRGFALWWTDLSAPDPYFVLPLVLGALMYLQQRLTPTTMDPAQAKVMQFMPVMVTMFMLFLPAGLCVYMLTNSVLGIGQQKLNEWRLSRESAPAVAAVDAGPRAGNDSSAVGGAGTPAPAPRGSGRSRRG